MSFKHTKSFVALLECQNAFSIKSRKRQRQRENVRMVGGFASISMKIKCHNLFTVFPFLVRTFITISPTHHQTNVCARARNNIYVAAEPSSCIYTIKYTTVYFYMFMFMFISIHLIPRFDSLVSNNFSFSISDWWE